MRLRGIPHLVGSHFDGRLQGIRDSLQADGRKRYVSSASFDFLLPLFLLRQFFILLLDKRLIECVEQVKVFVLAAQLQFEAVELPVLLFENGIEQVHCAKEGVLV